MALYHERTKNQDAALRAAFKVFDKEAKGYIDWNTLKYVYCYFFFCGSCDPLHLACNFVLRILYLKIVESSIFKSRITKSKYVADQNIFAQTSLNLEGAMIIVTLTRVIWTQAHKGVIYVYTVWILIGRYVLVNAGEPLNELEAEQMMKEADKDGDGTIDYEGNCIYWIMVANINVVVQLGLVAHGRIPLGWVSLHYI